MSLNILILIRLWFIKQNIDYLLYTRKQFVQIPVTELRRNHPIVNHAYFFSVGSLILSVKIKLI